VIRDFRAIFSRYLFAPSFHANWEKPVKQPIPRLSGSSETRKLAVILATGVLVCALSVVGAAQVTQAPTQNATTENGVADPDKTTVDSDQTQNKSTGDAATGAKPASEKKLSRWFELQTATLTARYRFTEDNHGDTSTNAIQHQEVFRGRFKFDAAGRYSLNATVGSGNQFIGSWNNTGAGTGQVMTNLYLKHLFLSAQPVTGIEIQYGGLGLLRGESSEITSYDNDGYIVGERVSLKIPKRLFFDEISVTYAYLGDLNRPDLNKRYHRLQQSNYHQFLVSKKFGPRVAASADYTFQSGVETLRQAVKLDIHEAKLIDALRYEDYERLDVHPAYGFALVGEKRLNKRFTMTGGYAHIDRFYGGLNADRFNFGHRAFLLAAYAVIPEFTVSSFFDVAVNHTYAESNRFRFEVLFSYDLVKGLKRSGIL